MGKGYNFCHTMGYDNVVKGSCCPPTCRPYSRMRKRDRCEPYSTPQVISQGESPSSSKSDVDNLSNQVAMDKDTFPKVINAHVAGKHAIPVRNPPSLVGITLPIVQIVTTKNLCVEIIWLKLLIIQVSSIRKF